MRNFILGVAATTALLSTSVAVGASAEPSSQLIFGVDRAGDAPLLERVQFVFGGHNFCWYDSGWQGAGFYWCGYANRRGLGWGGGDGFHGWHGGHGAVGGANHSGGARVAVSHGAAQGGHGATVHGAAPHEGATHAAAHAPANHGGDDRKPGE
jgi:hypothetical protein